MRATVVGVILAGGGSRRMGRDKAALRRPDGRSFLEYSLDLLVPLCGRVIVAGRDPDPAIADASTVWLAEDPPRQGPIAGVLAALHYAASQSGVTAALTVAVDMPGVRAADIAALLRCYADSLGDFAAGRARPIAATADGHFAEPLLAIYPVAARAELEAWVAAGDRSLARWLRRQDPRLVRLDDPALINVNTPDQLQRWQPSHPKHPTRFVMTPSRSSSPSLSSLSLSPERAIDRLAQRLMVVDSEAVPLGDACGRVLRESIQADRDSPAADVSAMDGYAVRMADLSATAELEVRGESRPGHRPAAADPAAVMRVFTGGIVPAGFDAVIRREDTEEHPQRVRLLDAAKRAALGQNIRRRGENIAQGTTVVASGDSLTPGRIAAAANFGASRPLVSRRVRVAVIVTGDELLGVDQAVQPWQLRDSNGYALSAMLTGHRWIELVGVQTTGDSLKTLSATIAQALSTADAVVLSGGVSMGDYDHVPAAVQACGAETVFHRLPLRPGKPILGAATPAGQLILGLPGNPVSAAVCGRRFLLPLLGRMAGCAPSPRLRVRLANPSERTLPLWWMQLVQVAPDGRTAQLVASKGSGDLVSLGRSDGFVEVPPHDGEPRDAAGPWPFWSWL